jgi:hypothetical protein
MTLNSSYGSKFELMIQEKLADLSKSKTLKERKAYVRLLGQIIDK